MSFKQHKLKDTRKEFGLDFDKRKMSNILATCYLLAEY